MTRLLPAQLLLLVSFASAAQDFDRDVRPIFAEHCLECHSLDKSKGGLALVSRESATKKLKSGHTALVPGKPEASEIVARMSSTDPEEQMPPPEHREKHPLTGKEVEILRAWIAEGAEWKPHWAYRPVLKPPVPRVEPGTARPDSRALSHPIDAFILAKLAESKVTLSPEADRVTLMRRVWSDLAGLPPSPEQVDAFVNDRSPGAYERMVDAALASEHFGERWGRHWLDMARYADSDGYEKDNPRKDAWRYRDWVIQAINEDLPFDQFTIEQIAGDLLPDATSDQILATAFHRQTLTNTEGGTDQEQFRIDACFDRTETTGTVWLGLTVGCARCHTHKYDQLTQKEYYQLFAFYNNGDEVTRQVPTSDVAWREYEKANGAGAKKLAALQKKVDEARSHLRTRLPEWEKTVQPRLAEARSNPKKATFAPLPVRSVSARGRMTFKKLEDGSYLADGKKVPATDTYIVELVPPDQPLTALQIEVLPDDSLPGKGPGRNTNGNFVLSEVKLVLGETADIGVTIPLHSPTADVAQKTFGAEMVLDDKPQTGWAISGFTGKPHQLSLQLARPVAPAKGRKLFLKLEQDYAQGTHVLGRFRILGSSDVTVESIAPAAVIKVLDEYPDRRNPALIPPLYAWLEKVDDEFVAASSALELAQARLPKPPLMDVRVIAQRAANPRTTKLLYRGDFLTPTDEVRPDFPLVVRPSGGAQMHPQGGTANAANMNRLHLARWLVSPENPLTSRVTVNHIWSRLFGEGLVRTVADFGVRGERPTHPELLDWLAATFVEDGWSRKKLIRTILLSATYRQSSATRPDMADVDPQNRLLHRQNRFRVEGEIVRDLCLAASGLISSKIGGPSVFPPMPEDVAALSYANNFKWTTSTGEDRYRRGMYTFFKRTAPHPDLTTFDCPDANLTNVKRTVSDTPLQALTTLNAEAFAESAKALAQRVLNENLANDDERITRAFRLCVSRVPTAREVGSLRKLLYDSRAWYESHPEEAAALGAHGKTPGSSNSIEQAVWTATVRVILNLDEFLTRE